MSKIKFIHFRNYITDEGLLPLHEDMASKGGTTVAFISAEGDGKVTFAVAKCGPRDVYCKARGRMIAEGRLLKGKSREVTIEQGQSVYDVIAEAL